MAKKRGEAIVPREEPPEGSVYSTSHPVDQIPRDETWEDPQTLVDPSGWLDARQRRFAALYLETGNVARSYQAAGFETAKLKDASANGCRLLRRPEMIEFLDELRERLKERLAVSVEKTLDVIAGQAYQDPGELFNDDGTLRPIREIPLHARRTIKGLETKTYMERTGTKSDGSPIFEEVKVTKVKIAPALPAAVKLGEHLGLFEPEGGTKVALFVVEVPQRAESSDEWAKKYAGRAMRRIAGADDR